jgi:hypothetical protein
VCALSLNEIGDENSDDESGFESLAEGDDEGTKHGESVIEALYLRNSYVA